MSRRRLALHRADPEAHPAVVDRVVMPLRVLTVNLGGTTPPLDERMRDLIEYLERERFDVVGFQEVGDWGGRTQADRVAEAVGYATVHHIDAGREGRPGEGLAIVTDLDADPAPTVHLPESDLDHPRALQQLDVVHDGTVVRVANTHLAWRLDLEDIRMAQTERIRDELAGWTGPVVLMGDLNDVPGSPPLRVLTAPPAGLVDCYLAVHGEDRWTFHPDNPYTWQPELLRRRVDHVLVRGLEVLDAAVVLTGRDAPVVSDHYAVRAELRTG
jgi:endonuclease/exonuclease/phosphatase family metal-dependent hydrolase